MFETIHSLALPLIRPYRGTFSPQTVGRRGSEAIDGEMKWTQG
jgi:hypothetical protein